MAAQEQRAAKILADAEDKLAQAENQAGAMIAEAKEAAGRGGWQGVWSGHRN